MKVELAIIDTSERGVQVALGEGTPFWLPRTAPGLEWLSLPEIGDVVWARLPRWIVEKHGQLQALRYQRSLSFHQPPGFGPEAAREGSFPMAYDNNLTGALFRNRKKEKPSHPDYRGECEINGGKFWVSGWIKKSGETYMSLAFRAAEEPKEPAKPSGGPTFREDEPIPFAPAL